MDVESQREKTSFRYIPLLASNPDVLYLIEVTFRRARLEEEREVTGSVLNVRSGDHESTSGVMRPGQDSGGSSNAPVTTVDVCIGEDCLIVQRCPFRR